MRLFLGVLLEEKVKDNLQAAILLIENSTRESRPTFRENLHLTLVFLGETGRVAEIRQAMDQVWEPPFSIEIAGIGRFRREGGDLYWTGVKRSKPLERLYRRLKEELVCRGFAIEDRPYRPHLTLARQVREDPQTPFAGLQNALEPVESRAAAVSLMESVRVQGKLVYREIYRRELTEKGGEAG